MPWPTLSVRFHRKVNYDGPNGCWVWTASQFGDSGYGRISHNNRSRGAHRVAYELYVGPIPEGLTIDHLCRNRSCVNPAHLEAVPIGVNILRGENPAARNARKTHCKWGHEFTPENTGKKTGGGRRCRACARRRLRQYREQHSASA